MRSRHAGVTVAALALAAGLGGCSSGPISYIVLTMQSDTSTPINGVTDVSVQVIKGTTQMKTLTYHHAALNIDQVNKPTLSVSFTSGEVGNISFGVDAFAAGCLVGTGTTTGMIQRGATTPATVSLRAVTGCPQADAGADGSSPDAFPGCDPVSPSCGGDGPMTCQVNCRTKLAECTAAGSGAPGSTCQMNSDCTPGTQCFDYSGTGCNVKLCLRFCNSAAQCTQPGPEAGVTPGSVCMGPVQCSGAPTAYHTCTFACDPRFAAASSGATGCPSGLACLVVGTADQVDCACAEATRTKREGDACTLAADCEPGLVCDFIGGSGTCRPLCRCDLVGTSCSNAQNDCPTAGTHCAPLLYDTLYGACIP